jgi:hypothetical protein
MSNSISTLLLRNLSDVCGENDPVRRRAAIDEIVLQTVPGPPVARQFACHPDLLCAFALELEFFRIRTTEPPSSKETSSISVFMR